MMIQDILVVNPGSTSTKIAVYTEENQRVLFETNIVHDAEQLLEFPTVASQKEYRQEMILAALAEEGYALSDLSAVVGRGGMVYGLSGGGYQVDEKLCAAMSSSEIPQHASSLGALLAYAIAEPLSIPSYIYDSTMGCDLMDIAKITGIAEVEKYGATHLLNSRAQAIRYASSIGRDYRDMQLIVCHMGGGITANAWKDGKVVDVSSYDDGPMSPERSGGVPLLLFARLCFDGKHTQEDVKELISGRGGLYGYLGTKDCQEIERRIEEGDTYAATIYEAMAYQVAKAIAGLSCALKGQVDAVLLTGGIAHSRMLTEMIKEYCGHIGEMVVLPGEREMEALADGALRMLRGEEKPKRY